MKKKRINAIENLLEWTVYVYMVAMVAVFPLFYNDGYFDILTAKSAFFRYSSIGTIAVVLLLIIIYLLEQSKGTVRKSFLQQRDWIQDPSNWFAIIFILAVVLSTVLSPYLPEAWKGATGRYLGAEAMLLCVFLYLVVARFLKVGMGLIWTFLISNILIFIIGILNFWGIDVLEMKVGLIKSQYAVFQSTIGNINFFSSYLCLVLPVGLVLFYLSENRFSKIIYGSFLIMGFYVTYMTTTDSWILGIGAAFFVLLWFSMESYSGMERFLKTVSLFWFASLLVGISIKLGELLHIESDMFKEFVKLKIQNTMIAPIILLISGLVLVLSYCLLKYVEKSKQINLKKWRNIIFSVFLCLFLSGVICLIIANKKEEAWKGVFSCFNSLKIDDKFGNGRGFIWRRTIEIFSDSSFLRKIFGCGLNCFKEYINVTSNGVSFIDAHNEFLQFMVTTGILGVIGYFGLLVSSAIRDMILTKKSPIFMVGTLVVCSYLAQGLVNNPQIITTPYLFLLLGAAKSLERKYEK